jgi:steroid delta-isomerase-like uncharacterized protein
MEAERNKALILRLWDESVNKGNLAVIDELVAPHYAADDPVSAEPPRGPAAAKRVVTLFRTAFPDIQFTADEVIAEGNRVVARWTARGTHRGPFLGVPPTGRTVTLRIVDILTVEEGKLTGMWALFDRLDVLQQLGVQVSLPGERER